MKFKTIAGVAASLMVSLAASVSNAAIVDFSGYPALKIFPNSLISYQGLDFTFSAGGNNAYLIVWDGTSPNGNGTENLILSDSQSSFVTITKTGGGLFNLNSFDLSSSWFSPTGPNSVLLNGNPFAVNDVYTTYNVGLTNVSSVTISGLSSGGGYWQADNFNYSAGAIPEPATWAMMIIGFGAAGSMIRRRKAVVA